MQAVYSDGSSAGYFSPQTFNGVNYFIQIFPTESTAACAKLVDGVDGEGQILEFQTTPGSTLTTVLEGPPTAGSTNTYGIDFDAAATDSNPTFESSVFNSDLTATFYDTKPAGDNLPVSFYYGSGTVSGPFIATRCS